MRLVIDLQGAQGANRHRGIGRYCLSLTRGIARLRAEHDVVVVLSALFPDTIEPLRHALSDVLPPDAVRILHIAGQVPDADPSCDARRVAAELVREQFLASLNPDFVLVTSLFEGLGDDVVTSIGRFSSCIPTATVLYDLIPLIHSGIYLKNPVLEKWYERKLAHLRNADVLLAISESSRSEAIEWLDAQPEEVVNISTAAEAHFTPAVVDSVRRAELGAAYGLIRPFVLYTGGIDHRKNIEGLIEAYALLPLALRRRHQLAIVCSIEPAENTRLSALALQFGLEPGELVLTGYIPEQDLLDCYRACEVFVFPSWHEGFGLPALEAMKCGRAVIASDRSSLPEVIGYEDALFDPFDVAAMRGAIARVLEDESFRRRLEARSLEQAAKFDWDTTARRAWAALIGAHSRMAADTASPAAAQRRPRMAFFSPVPPVNSGISAYSAELIPELARHYQIDVIAPQEVVSDPGIFANQPVRSVDWFKRNADRFDRVIYHFGNSEFHSHMFDLIQSYPGVVVLHDFFLSGIVAHRDICDQSPGAWSRALFEEAGWPAAVHRFKAFDTADVVWAYPCNMAVLQDALGVIVHAEFSRHLARTYYGERAADDWHHIRHLRKPVRGIQRGIVRSSLGFGDDDFVVCSFGLLGPMKMNDRLLAAWLKSPLAKDPHCHLVFVGENNPGEYGAGLEASIRAARPAARIDVTGWTDAATFQKWLAAADVGVQLRTLSRGETSGTVLDCMNAGKATIVNANGSMAELPADCVWRLPDAFSDDELIEALVTLRRDSEMRGGIGARARATIAEHHNPRRIAAAYADAIEQSYAYAELGTFGLERSLIDAGEDMVEADWRALVQSVAANAPRGLRKSRLLVDISELVQRDWGSGIQRVVRSILMQWLRNPPADYIVEPVYAVLDTPGYRYARKFTSAMLDIPGSWTEDEVVEARAGDVFIGLDLQPAIVPKQQSVLQDWRRNGVVVRFVIYDLLPVIAPEFFFPGARPDHHAWLETISRFDGVICISRAVADEFRRWADRYQPKRIVPLDIDWFHLGADHGVTTSERRLPETAEAMLGQLRKSPSFLAVATIEPRKGFRQTLDAMELLWGKGIDVNLVIVGKPGWMMDDFIERLRQHPALGRRLFWFEGVSDDYLGAIYEACFCLLAASEGEGFGLPLIEAANHGLPILARDLPVFREVAGDSARYFANTQDPETLAAAIEGVVALGDRVAADVTMEWLGWAESADMLLARVLGTTEPYQRWMPCGADHGSGGVVRST